MAAAVIPAATEDVTSTVKTGDVPVELQEAEASFWRSAIIGVLIGMPVCVVIWTGIVALAMTITGANLDWGVMLDHVGDRRLLRRGVLRGLGRGHGRGREARGRRERHAPPRLTVQPRFTG